MTGLLRLVAGVFRLQSLAVLFVLTLLLATVGPFLAIGWWASGAIQEQLQARVADRYLPDLVEHAGSKIHTRLGQARETCSILAAAARPVLAAPGGVEEGGGAEELEAFLALVDKTPRREIYFQSLLLADADGHVVCVVPSSRTGDPGARELIRLQPRDVTAEPWFQRIAAGAEEWWVDRHLSPYLHAETGQVLTDPSDYSLGIAFAVGDGTGRDGALFALLRWTRVQGVLDDMRTFMRERSTELFLVDGGGRYLGSTDRRRYGGVLEPENLRRAVLSDDGPATVSFDEVAGGERLAVFRSLVGEDRFRLPEGFRWRLGLHAPKAEIFATSRQFTALMLQVSALTALILVTWSLVASRLILGPVRRLVSATERLAHGDRDVRVEIKGRSELADLGDAFNRMASDLESSEQQLRAAEREAAWAEVARQVAHEIKNPLTPMKLAAQMMQRARAAGDDRVEELADRMARTVLEQTEALARIAGDFRLFAGLPAEHSRPQRVEARVLLEDTVRFFEPLVEQQAVKFVVEVEVGEGAAVEVEPHEMRQVLINLVQNAVDAAEGARARIELRAVRSDGRIVFRVVDDGPGIREELLPTLFTPYFTTKSSGTGLGLVTCRRIVEKHGGSMRLASSRPGETVFEFELPAAGSARPQAGRPAG